MSHGADIDRDISKIKIYRDMFSGPIRRPLPALDIIADIGFISFVPSLLQGAFHERRETRGGKRWPYARLRREAPHGGPSCDDPAHRPWVTSGGYQEEPPGLVRSTVSVLRGCRRASLKHRARNAGAVQLFRGATNLMRITHIAHGAAGRLRARRSAHPSPLKGIKRR